MEIITRQEAIAQGLRRYFTGKPCKHGHVAERSTHKRRCVGCAAADSKARYHAKLKHDPGFMAEARQRAAAWFHDNHDHALQTRKDNYLANRDARREQKKAYYCENKHIFMESSAARKARVRRATPPWCDRSAIAAVYKVRVQKTKQTGVEHHVDHIVPLLGRNVCGLHVPWNLQVITAEENLAKNNKMPEEFYGPDHTPPTWQGGD